MAASGTTTAGQTATVLAPAPGGQTAEAVAVNDLGVAAGYSWFGIYRGIHNGIPSAFVMKPN